MKAFQLTQNGKINTKLCMLTLFPPNFFFIQLWDLSQRCEARKHSHQSEMHHFPNLLYRNATVVMWPQVINIFFQIILQQSGLKLGDFGSCRSVYSKPPHTEYISTRWYRAPECLLTDGYYSFKMDMWSAGCVFFEIMRYLWRGMAWHFHL